MNQFSTFSLSFPLNFDIRCRYLSNFVGFHPDFEIVLRFSSLFPSDFLEVRYYSSIVAEFSGVFTES